MDKNDKPKLFKVRVTMTTSYDSFVVVAAHSEAQARAFLDSYSGWHDDSGLDDEWGGNYSHTYSVQQVQQVTKINEVKEIYHPKYRAWNPLNGTFYLKDMLEDGL